MRDVIYEWSKNISELPSSRVFLKRYAAPQLAACNMPFFSFGFHFSETIYFIFFLHIFASLSQFQTPKNDAGARALLMSKLEIISIILKTWKSWNVNCKNLNIDLIMPSTTFTKKSWSKKVNQGWAVIAKRTLPLIFRHYLCHGRTRLCMRISWIALSFSLIYILLGPQDLKK